MQSKAFRTLWERINRVAHQQIVAVLTCKKLARGVLVITSGKVLLDLSQVVRRVWDKLVAAGVAIAAKVPVVGSTIEIARVKGLESAQRVVRSLNTFADWLPGVGHCSLHDTLSSRASDRSPSFSFSPAHLVSLLAKGITRRCDSGWKACPQ